MIKRKKPLLQKMRENVKLQAALNILLPVAFGLLLLVLWQTQVLHRMLHTDTFTLPLPSRIVSIIADNASVILVNVQATLFVAVVGLVAGSLVGYLLAILAAIFPRWGAGGLSVVAAFNAIPIVALAPVMTNWTKDVSTDANIRSMAAKCLVVVIVSIASMSVNAYRGLTELQPYALDLLSSYAAGKGTVFLKLRLPNSLPYIFTALRVSVPASVISAIVSEYFAEYVIGVGRQIRENIVIAQYSTAWAYITVACLMGIVLYGILMLIEGIMLKHRK